MQTRMVEQTGSLARFFPMMNQTGFPPFGRNGGSSRGFVPCSDRRGQRVACPAAGYWAGIGDGFGGCDA